MDSASQNLMRAGMAQGLRAVGLEFDSLPRVQLTVGQHPGATKRSDPVAVVEEFLKEHPDLTAVVATGDGLGVRLIKAVRKLGVSIPQDLSVIVLGDLQAFELMDPALTVVSQPHTEIGRVAAQRLLQRLAGDTSPAQSTWLQPELVSRESVRNLCGPSPDQPVRQQESDGF